MEPERWIFLIVALLNYMILVNEIMMLLLWRRYYSMALFIIMTSAAAIN
jgi:hypothetical protein